MKYMTGIRARLILLAAACTAPVFILLAYDTWRAGKEQIDVAKADLRARSRAAALDLSRDIRAGRSLLRSLVQISGSLGTNPAECSARLKEIAAPYSEFGSAFVIGKDGTIRCTISDDAGSINVSDRDYFLQAITSRSIVYGKPTLSRRNGDRYILPIAMAVRNDKGEAGEVVAIGVNISRFAADVLSSITGAAILTWWDSDGRILFRWPNPEAWIDKVHPESVLYKAVMSQGAGSVDEAGADGVVYVHGISEIGSTGHTLTLSVTRNALLGQHQEAFIRNVAALLLISMAGFAIAWVFGEVLIRRPLTALARFGQKIVEGNLDTRSNMQDVGGEIETVAKSIDRMADALTAQITALKESESRLRENLDRTESAERRLRHQLEYMNLLDQITRSIEEKLDLHSIFQVIVRTVEDRLPVELCCVAVLDAVHGHLRVESCSGKGALSSILQNHEHVSVDGNGLARCLGGEVVYEADVQDIQLPFMKRLSSAGVRAIVLAPLRGESRIFGVLIAARATPDSFTSTETEFLRQLSEHAALASHQALLHGALQQAYDDLRQTQQVVMQEERLRALGQMASGVAHDINNALSPVSLYTTTLLEGEVGLSERARRYLETIQQAVEDVAETVARMREFYRKSDERLDTRPIHLNQVVKQVIELTRARWSDMAQRQGVSIDAVAVADPGDPRCLGVESEIREALTNLIFNGVDAMPEGGQLVVRTLRRAGPDGQTSPIIQVCDEGMGMSPAVRERCLEPFFTTKGERGTGLGLAMVFGTMQRHGGQVEIESEEGAGTTISLVFPPFVESNRSVDQPNGKLDRPRRLRLLLVDDDPILLRSLQETLESDGHVTTIANGGAEGIAVFQNAAKEGRRFDAVITDLGMPQIDGRKVAAAIKKADETMPVILLTGWGKRLVADGDVPPYVDRLVSKPPKLPALRRALAEVVRVEKIAESLWG